MSFLFSKKFHAGLLAVLFLVLSPVKSLLAESTYVIDTPTKGMLGYGNYDIDFRFFSGGGILSRMTFGVFKIVDLGVGWETDSIIGTQTATAAPPSLFLKIKPFSGGMVLPGFAIGYDGQGYYYNKDVNAFAEREKGIFIVFGREILTPGLNFNAGLNMNDFKENKLCGFTNFEYDIEEKFKLLCEYDNINYFPEARLNAGVRISITEDIFVDAAGRDILSNGRTAERIIRIAYLGRF